MQTHEYEVVNPTHYKNNRACIEAYTKEGWRLVAVIPPPTHGSGYTHSMVFEKPIKKQIELKSPGTVEALIENLRQFDPKASYSLMMTLGGNHSYLIIGEAGEENAVPLT
jgi:hypothetical protein